MSTTEKQESPTTQPPCNSRKRLLHNISDTSAQEREERDFTANENHDRTMEREQGDTIRQLRLEAIFHPKFDNENRNKQDVRQQMKDRVSSGKGFLEVSLKHSGSLLLWSGGQRYYSKNSTDNCFSNVGEILLRQHFYRAWHSNDANNHKHDDPEQAYTKCSNHVEGHRLTLAFELVTAVLGHHGSIPHRDFLILTAVADKKAERFYSTAELVALAQKFRLPHNDSWIFSSLPSADALFHLYDTTRETGLAEDTCNALTTSAEEHVCSMYPHTTFQGDILEGIVIRYVAYQTPDGEQPDSVMDQLAASSKEMLLEKIPPDTPACFELVARKNLPSKMLPVLTTDLRQVYRECFKSSSEVQEGTMARFEAHVREILILSDGDCRRTTQRSATTNNTNEIYVPGLVKKLLRNESDLDDETKRIAKAIFALDKIKGKATYKILRETTSDSGRSRLLCIIHIIHDGTFKSFQNQMKAGDMELYRGFSVELLSEKDIQCCRSDTVINCDLTTNHIISDSADTIEEDSALMLKMKFLPYMVRTFGCRNGLRQLKQGGPSAFEKYVVNLMHKWKISQKSIAIWHPFFLAWATYAFPRIQERDGESATIVDNGILPLNSTYYLDHLEKFNELYHSGSLEIGEKGNGLPPTQIFSGTVLVISLDEQTSENVARCIAQKLGNIRHCCDVNGIQEQDLILSCLPKGGGMVCSGTIKNGIRKRVKNHLQSFQKSISIVLVGCTDENTAALAADQEQRKLCGMIKGFRKFKCAATLDISSAFDASENSDEGADNTELHSVLNKLWEVSEAIPKPDMRPGLLFFFPGIPGCGKSTLCNTNFRKSLQDVANDGNHSPSNKKNKNKTLRHVPVLHGDEVKSKYWQAVKRERAMVPSSIVIADKNAPPSGWVAVGDVCSTSNGWAVPIFPDEKALATTSITGVKGSDGSFQADICHHYPFSLHYLAVCMTRVLARPPNTHAGKLDSATKNACLIVAKFFGFYRNISSTEFLDTVTRKFLSSGASESCLQRPLRVPFFAPEEIPDLPSELKEALVQALQLQHGYERERKDVLTVDSEIVQKIDGSLRSLLQKHKGMLDGLSCTTEESQSALLSQATTIVTQLNSGLETPETIVQLPLEKDSKVYVKLVSIDVDVGSVHKLIRTCAETSCSASNFINMACPTEDKTSVSSGTRLPGESFVRNTHVTLVHCLEMKQSDIYERFGKLEGRSIVVKATGFLWSADKVAALVVELSLEAEDEAKETITATKNSFPHITVWHSEGTRPVLSNMLPEMVQDGKAEQITFEKPHCFKGIVSFWTNGKSSS